MITGIGIDSVDQDRITKIYSKFGQKFQDKILGPNEKEELKNKSNNFQKLDTSQTISPAKRLFLRH